MSSTRIEHDLLGDRAVPNDAYSGVQTAGALEDFHISGITANEEVCRHYVEYSIGVVTALNPVIGYERATELAAEAMQTGRGIIDRVREKGLLSDSQIAEVLNPAAMTGQGRV